MVLLVCCHVIYMRYLFPREWADTPRALAFIDAMASIVPAISNLRLHVAEYTNYWGMFYATFWATYPVYILLGFIGSFYLSEYRYQKAVLATTWNRVALMSIVIFPLGIVIFYFPMLYSFAVHQISSFLPRLIMSWVATMGSGYMASRMTMIIFFKSNLQHLS